jgi:uncharacterized protein (TIGR04255 family)
MGSAPPPGRPLRFANEDGLGWRRQVSTHDELVTFDRPPLDEVVMGVQFDREVSDDAFALADYWPKIRESFPKLEKQPPLPKAVEDFTPTPSVGGPQIELLTSPPSPRYWFISDDETRLVQVQSDRLLFNWRKREQGQEYPRYRQLRDEFNQQLEIFMSCLREDVRNQLGPVWCEVSYINHFEAVPESGHGHRPLSDFLRLVVPVDLRHLPKPEDTQLQQRYVLRQDDGVPVGRFYLSSTPAYRASDTTPVHVVTLLVRLKEEPSTHDITSALGRGHEVLVESFEDMTTPAAHELWGLRK